MAWTRAALALVAAGAVAVAVVSGGTSADPRTPVGLPGLPPPFLGTAVVGDGGLTAAIDAYGDVVDLRAPGPAGRALIDNPAARQAAGSVAADTGIVPRVRVGGGPALAMWQADSVAQRYLPGTNVAHTVARFGPASVAITSAAMGDVLAVVARTHGAPVRPTLGVATEPGLRCGSARTPTRATLVCSAGVADPSAAGPIVAGAVAGPIIAGAAAADRRWTGRARALGTGAPRWARQLYRRSLLTLRALTDRHTGAVAAGVRDGWAYVWPRDAGAVALALAAAGYRTEAHRVARFLLSLDLAAAARFHGDGSPVAGREAQGDAWGWAAVAARAAGLPPPAQAPPWRNRPDYQERDAGDYLANAIATSEPYADRPQASGIWTTARMGQSGGAAHRPGFGAFETPRGLVRRSEDPGSGLDSAAAWAVRPFAQPALFPAARRTLLRLAAGQTRFGITPGEAWDGRDPWTAPTAWAAWSLAALAGRRKRDGGPAPTAARRDRRAALRLLGDLRRAATPAGTLPERVDADTGIPRSTTPLAWSHAFAILALLQLWPSRSALDFYPTQVG